MRETNIFLFVKIFFSGRDQIMMSRGLSDVAVVVVANKMDLLSHPDTEERGKLRQDISNKVGQTATVSITLICSFR